ncbi:Phenylalanine--tRNA ligase beta subunit [Alphaproteobacteria bacterium]
MKITYNWLKKYLASEASVEDICNALNSIGLEVDTVKDFSNLYSQFVVAVIEIAAPHPNSSKLSVCTVYDSKQRWQVVCGAPNARTGIKVVLAPIGAVIPSNGMVIRSTSIRGIESCGMLCSAEELKLTTLPEYSKNQDGIIELDQDATVGCGFAKYAGFNDTLIDISLTPNRRQDCANVYGIARDLAATRIGTLVRDGIDCKVKCDNENGGGGIHAEILDVSNCSEFCLFRIDGITQNATKRRDFQTMLYMVDSIHANSLVNISNFSMFELGRPNHIYDADKIKGSITVRMSKAGEHFIALGGEEYTLKNGITVIADGEKILGVAGIIGGELSKIDENTKNILVEVANFNPEAIYAASKALNIHTEAKYRFEGLIDHGNTDVFITYLQSLIILNCGGYCYTPVKLTGKQPQYTTEMKFDFNRIQSFIGHAIDATIATRILRDLGFVVSISQQTKWELIIPTWKQGNITTEEGIIEEIVRIYGIDKLSSYYAKVCPKNIMRAAANTEPVSELRDVNRFFSKLSTTTTWSQQELMKLIQTILLGRGFSEAITWSFISRNCADNFGLSTNIEIKNPISADLAIMRSSIVPNLLDIVYKNEARGCKDLMLFEAGNIYDTEFENLQAMCIAGICSGFTAKHDIHKERRTWDFFDVKGDVMEILNGIGMRDIQEKCSINTASTGYYHPGCSAEISLQGEKIACYGEIHPSLLKKLKLQNAGSIVAFEIFLENISRGIVQKNISQAVSESIQVIRKPPIQLSPYQSVERDFAFLVNQNVEAFELVKIILRLENELIEDVKIFDAYRDDRIERGKKSIAIRVTLRSKSKTLTELEINNVSMEIIREIEIKIVGRLRDCADLKVI